MNAVPGQVTNRFNRYSLQSATPIVAVVAHVSAATLSFAIPFACGFLTVALLGLRTQDYARTCMAEVGLLAVILSIIAVVATARNTRETRAVSTIAANCGVIIGVICALAVL